MKPTGLSKKNTESSALGGESESSNNFGGSSQKNLPTELMDRLAKGARVEVSKKEMYALTNKNYENLPEVKRRKEEEKKKEEYRLR